MAAVSVLKQVNLIKCKLDLLKDERQQFLETVESYFNYVDSLGRSFVDHHGGGPENFKDVSQAIETAMNFLSDKAIEFRTQLKNEPTGTARIGLSDGHARDLMESSGSLSFVVLPDLQVPLGNVRTEQSQLLSAGMPTEQSEMYDKQFKSHSEKLEALSNTLVRVIADISNLKKQQMDVSVATITEMNSIPSRSIEENESFVEVKKNLSHLSSDVENISKRHDSVFKELSSLKADSLNSLDRRLKELEAKADINIRDLATKVNGLENGHCKLSDSCHKLESNFNEMDNRINETDLNLSQLQERTSLVINEKESEIKAMHEQLQQTSKVVSELKDHENLKGTEKIKCKELELSVRGLEIWAKMELEEKLKQVGENVRKLEGEQRRDSELVGEHIAEVNCVLDRIREKQSSLQSRISSYEENLPKNFLPVELQLPYMKVGARVKKGPNWPAGINDPGYGSIVTEVPNYNTVSVRWDDGRIGNYKAGGNWNSYEIQLA